MHAHASFHLRPVVIEFPRRALPASRNQAHFIARQHVRVPFFSKQGRTPAASVIRMSGLAVPTPERAATLSKSTKRERINPKIAKAVNLILTGECTTQKAAAERIGVSATYLCTQLKKPAVEAFIARRARETIAQGKMRASARLIELLDASSEHVSLDATKHVLAIEGIRPPDQGQVNVNVGVSVGYVIDLSGNAGNPSATVIDTQLTHTDSDT